MKKVFILISILVAASANACPVRLRTNNMANPIGVDDIHIRFAWTDTENADYYNITVGTDSTEVAKGNGLWTSERVDGKATAAAYDLPSLKPRTCYYWKVTAYSQGVKAESAVARFETGLMDSPWQGAWISDHNDKDFMPAPYFRKAFSIGKTVASARAYIAVAGLYSLYLNGREATHTMLNPVYTRYDRRISYQTYDITSLLTKGDNAVGVLLGNGWYNHQAIASWDFDRAPWRNRPAFCMDIYVTYTDGSTETISTDLSWRTSQGALDYNNIYTGEHYDFNKVPQGWNTAAFDDSAWQGVRFRQAPAATIWSQQMTPIVCAETLRPVSVGQINDTTWVYDFGKNIAGVTTLSIKGEQGARIRLIHTERLHPDGTADQGNIDIYYRGDKEKEPFQTDIYTLSGQHDTYTTQFGYKGFRYVQAITDRYMKMSPDNITAHFVHSEVEEAGTMTSSDDMLNRIFHATRASYLSNLMGFPTDCPQREKNGWTGDGHLAIETALYNYDAVTVYEKWMQDHRDEQQPNGVLPDIIPTDGWGYGTDNGLDWTSTICIIPWQLYVFYGDTHTLRLCYDNMKRYVDYVDRNSPQHLSSWGRGDWVPVKTQTPKEFTSSVYFHIDAAILAKTAALLGHKEDSVRYTRLAEDIWQAINAKYLLREEKRYKDATQTMLSMALRYDIVPKELKQDIARQLNDMVAGNGYHIDTGILGAKSILDALSLNGYAETAFRLATQTTFPSWGFWIKNGATTLQENWQVGTYRDASDNHIMFGEMGAWPYKGLAGIYPDENNPGFRHIILKPNFVKGLNHFCATHRSPYGVIKSEWKKMGKKVVFTVTIPQGCTATYNGRTVEAGTTTFEIKEVR